MIFNSFQFNSLFIYAKFIALTCPKKKLQPPSVFSFGEIAEKLKKVLEGKPGNPLTKRENSVKPFFHKRKTEFNQPCYTIRPANCFTAKCKMVPLFRVKKWALRAIYVGVFRAEN